MRFFSKLVLLSWSLWSGCATTMTPLDQVKEEYGLRRIPDASDFPQSDAVVVGESHTYEIEFDNNHDTYTVGDHHHVIKVFKNLEEHSNVEIFLGYKDNLLSIEARTINPDGNIISLNNDEFHHASGVTFGSEFVSDRRAVRFAFRGVEKGSVLEYHYKIRSDFGFGGTWWVIQNSIPTVSNVFKLSVPRVLTTKADWNWYYKAYNFDVEKPLLKKQEPTNQTKYKVKDTYIWRLRKIKHFREEPMMPSWQECIGQVFLSEKYTWDEIAEHYIQSYWLPRANITPAVQKLAASLTAGSTTIREKAQRLSDYVKNIRYTAIELGVGGWMPTEPMEVVNRKYGDCKDKSTLLTTLCRAVDITAKPVLVRTMDIGGMDSSVPSRAWFNHMIVKIDLPEGTVWTDPTSSLSPFGETPWFIRGVDGLVLETDGKGAIERIPEGAYGDNVTSVSIDVILQSSSELSFHFMIKSFGASALYRSNILHDLSEHDLAKYCKALIADEFVDARVTNISTTPRKEADDPYVIEFDASIPNGIQFQGDLGFVNVDPFKLFDNLQWLSAESRKHPVAFNYPWKTIKDVRMRLPTGTGIRNLPSKVRLSNDFLDYDRTFTVQSDSVVVLEEVFAMKARTIPVSDYPTIRQILLSIKKSGNEKVIIGGKIQ